MTKKIQLKEERVFHALIQMICRGETHITRYKVANEVSGVPRSTVYEIFQKYSNKETKCLQLQNQ